MQVVTMGPMTVSSSSRGVASRSRAHKQSFAGGAAGDGSKLIGVKGTHHLHQRLRDACDADGVTMGELISALLDLREQTILTRVNGGNPLRT